MGCEGHRGSCGSVDYAVWPAEGLPLRHEWTAFESLIIRAAGTSKLSVPICAIGSFGITQKPLKGEKNVAHLCVPGVVLLEPIILQLLQLWMFL